MPVQNKTQIIFWSGTKSLGQAQYVNQFLVWHKKFGPVQNVLGPVKGQGISLLFWVEQVPKKYFIYSEYRTPRQYTAVYIFQLTFIRPFLYFQERFSWKFWPYVSLVFKSSFFIFIRILWFCSALSIINVLCKETRFLVCHNFRQLQLSHVYLNILHCFSVNIYYIYIKELKKDVGPNKWWY